MTLNKIPHYYPIMLLKQGELDAVSQVNRICDPWYTPIFNVVPDSFWEYVTKSVNGKKKRIVDASGKFVRKPKDYRSTVEELASNLHDHWRHEYPLLLDGHLLTGSIQHNSRVHPIGDLIDAASEKEMSIIPVSGMNSNLRDASYQQAIKLRIQNDRKGVCLRIYPKETELTSFQKELDQLLRFFEVSESDVYLLLDFGYQGSRESFLGNIKLIPYLSHWKHVIIASGAFPKNQENKTILKANSSPRIERFDLLSWLDTVECPEMANFRSIEFADYTCRNPDFVPLFDMKSAPAAKITWTLDREFVHERGTQPRKGDLQFTTLAENLYAQEGIEEGLMVDICDADKFLQSIFDGNPDRNIHQKHTFWIGKGVEHHITLTVLQMHDLGGYGLPEQP